MNVPLVPEMASCRTDRGCRGKRACREVRERFVKMVAAVERAKAMLPICAIYGTESDQILSLLSLAGEVGWV